APGGGAALRLLAAGVDHSAKNMLAVVHVMLRRPAATRCANMPPLRRAGRPRSLARTLLSQTRWEGAWLHELIEEELSPWCRRDRDVTIAGPNIALPPGTAQSFVMAL